MCTNIRVALVAALVPPFHPFSNPHTHRTDAHAPSRRTPWKYTTPTTQIIVSLLGRLLSKVCSTMTRAAARRSRPSHRPSTIRRRSTESGIDAASILCHHLLHRASAPLSINQSILASCSHPQLLLAAAHEHQTQTNNTIVVSSVLINTLAWPAFCLSYALIPYLIVKVQVRQHYALIPTQYCVLRPFLHIYPPGVMGASPQGTRTLRAEDSLIGQIRSG
jgi:hypothetical protein